MGVSINNIVMYGVKLPCMTGLDDEFEDYLYDNHSPFGYGHKLDPNKIYVLDDCMCGEYTVVGFIIDMTEEDCGSFNGFVDITETKDAQDIYQFLYKKEFEEVVGDEIPDAELLIFSHVR